MADVKGATNGHVANGVANIHATNGMNGQTNDNSKQNGVKQRTKLGGIGPDGYPVLPPIHTPGHLSREDPYAKSKLMTFRLANHNQALLMDIL
ncbi:hypothetical protein ACJMK2_017020 [Sinanodonta woodiana]|uniref:Uncharacterized protein n=1 Tax=Sinanodonta woodiana TaxID=1069815 RepID=A0ABD3UVK3_SINWO